MRTLLKPMRTFFLLLWAALPLLPTAAHAQARSPAELEGLVAPIALYPDAVVMDVLASAVHAVEPWQPDAPGLAAYPQLVDSLAQNPRWAYDLGTAYLIQPVDTLAAVQSVRQRAAVPAYSVPADPAYFVVTRVVRQHGVVRQPAVVRRPVRVWQEPYHRVPESRRQPIVQSRVPPALPDTRRLDFRRGAHPSGNAGAGAGAVPRMGAVHPDRHRGAGPRVFSP